MNIYFVKNLETGRYLGDELEPMFEKAYFKDMDDAREAAYLQNVMHHKPLDSRDKYVVEVEKMNCPIMYVKYDNGCYRRFFTVHDAISFYEAESSTYEIGYEKNGISVPLDLTKDWKWTDESVITTHFDDHFWDSTFQGGFIQNPGKSFNAYYGVTKTVMVDNSPIEFNDRYNRNVRLKLKKALGNNAEFRDKDGNKLESKVESHYEYYDFGGSFTSCSLSLWYPNGRLFGFVSLDV